MIREHRTLLELTKTIIKQRKIISTSLFLQVLTPEIKKLFKNMQIPELCLKMILGRRILLVLTILGARTAENI